jgi:hypothetical protein
MCIRRLNEDNDDDETDVPKVNVFAGDKFSVLLGIIFGGSSYDLLSEECQME